MPAMGEFEGKVALITGAGSGLGRPDDAAYAVLYLASDEARFLTGIILPVDGGHTVA
jgi:NAD(P)-dependent dehydrogenase (short-subunit alcohol dehydrogenase family)